VRPPSRGNVPTSASFGAPRRALGEAPSLQNDSQPVHGRVRVRDVGPESWPPRFEGHGSGWYEQVLRHMKIEVFVRTRDQVEHNPRHRPVLREPSSHSLRRPSRECGPRDAHAPARLEQARFFLQASSDAPETSSIYELHSTRLHRQPTPSFPVAHRGTFTKAFTSGCPSNGMRAPGRSFPFAGLRTPPFGPSFRASPPSTRTNDRKSPCDLSSFADRTPLTAGRRLWPLPNRWIQLGSTLALQKVARMELSNHPDVFPRVLIRQNGPGTEPRIGAACPMHGRGLNHIPPANASARTITLCSTGSCPSNYHRSRGADGNLETSSWAARTTGVRARHDGKRSSTPSSSSPGRISTKFERLPAIEKLMATT